jgi:hypothetical protein
VVSPCEEFYFSPKHRVLYTRSRLRTSVILLPEHVPHGGPMTASTPNFLGWVGAAKTAATGGFGSSRSWRGRSLHFSCLFGPLP